MKIALLLAAGLVAAAVLAALVLYGAGSMMPREHHSRLTATLRADRGAVWAALTDYAAMPGWWPAVKSVRVIVGPDLPFGGTWAFELADAPGAGTQLALTEDGWINPPMFRAIARWFIGLDATQRDFLAHLEAHLAAARP